MHRRHLPSLLLGVFALGWLGIRPSPARAAGTAGSVTRLTGAGQVSRGSAVAGLDVGAAIETGDVVSTAAGSRLELTMVDGAVITLGERAELAIEDYLFDGQGKGNGVLNLLRGALQAASGGLTRLAGKPFKVTSPIATIGIRGTTFFAGDIDQTFGVFLIEGTGVHVENAGGSVDLIRPGFGTTVHTAGEAPEEPKQWAPEKVQRSLDMTSF
jgi:hypothetical protein